MNILMLEPLVEILLNLLFVSLAVRGKRRLRFEIKKSLLQQLNFILICIVFTLL